MEAILWPQAQLSYFGLHTPKSIHNYFGERFFIFWKQIIYMPLPRRPGRKSPFRVRRGRLLGKRRTVVTTKHPHRVRVGKRKVVIILPKQKKQSKKNNPRKKGGKKMPPRPRRPVKKPKATMRKSAWTPRGVATELHVRGGTLPITVGRPTAKVTRQRGFRIFSRDVGPKKRKVTI